MKKFYSLSMLAVAAMAAFSCSQELQPQEQPVPAGACKTITAYTDAAVTPDTKTTLSGVDVLWKASDAIKGYDGADKYTSTATTVDKTGKIATFTFDGVSVEQDLMYLAYPADAVSDIDDDYVYATIPTEQAATAEGFADGANVAVANGLEEYPRFKNVGGLVSIKINNDKIESVKLVADKPLTGTAIISMGDSDFAESAVEKGANEVTLTGGLENGKTYYAVVYPGTYTGLQLVITSTDGATATYTNPKTLTVERNSNLFIAELTIPESKWEKLADCVFFEERFTESTGTFGWEGNAASGTFKSDNEGWTVEKANGAGGSAKFGTASVLGTATTPEITIGDEYLSSTIVLSFKVGAWKSNSENTTLNLSAIGASIKDAAGADLSSVELVKGDWTEYTLYLTDITSPVTVTFAGAQSSNSRFLLDDVLVYYGAKPEGPAAPVETVATPTFSPAAGTVAAGTEVTISCTTSGASIYYTVDGTEPTKNSTLYSSAIVVNEAVTIKAFAVKEGFNDSEVATAAYVVNATVPYDVLNNAWTGITGTSYTEVTGLEGSYSNAVYSVQAAGGNDAIQLRSNNSNSGVVSTTSGGYVKSITVKWNSNTAKARVLDVYASNTAYAAATDLYDPAKQGTKVTSFAFSDGDKTFTFTADYKYIGFRSNDGALYLDEVDIEWGDDSQGAAPVVETVATPTFSPAAGAVAAGTEVTISCTTSGASIYYTVDGTEPTENSTLYSSAIVVNEAVIIKAFAVKEGFENSAVAEAAYTISAATGNDGSLEHPYTPEEAAALAKGGDTGTYYISGIVAKIQNQFDASFGTANFWLSVDGVAQNVFEGYKIKYLGNRNWVEGDKLIAVGDEVVINGPLTMYNTTAETSSGYIVLWNGKSLALTAPSLDVTIDNAAKTVTVTWGAASGSSEPITYTVTCGSQTYSATAAGSHTFTMSDYGVYAVSVVASADDALPAEASSAATLKDPSSSSSFTAVATETITMSGMGYTNAQEVSSISGTNYSIGFDKGTSSNAPKYYTSGTAIRVYSGNTITVTVEKGYSISSIVFAFGSSDGSNAITADKGTYAAGTWNGTIENGDSVVFTVGGTTGNRRISAITIN